MKRKTRKFYEGGMPDFEREPLRDSSGEIVRDSSGQPIMSGSTAARMMEVPAQVPQVAQPSPPVAQAMPVREPEMTRPSIGVEEFEEPGTAGFSHTPIKQAPKKQAPKPATKPVVNPTSKPVTKTEKPAEVAKKEMDAIEAGRKTKGKSEFERIRDYDKPLERVAPEMLMFGLPLRGLGAAAKMGQRAARVEPRVPQEAAKALTTKAPAKDLAKLEAKGAPRLEAPKGGELAKRGEPAKQLEAPRKRLPYEKDMGPVEFAAAKNKRRLLQGESSGKEAIKVQPRPYQRSTKSEPVDYEDIRMGSDYMRKGGKVGSASSRADGIAMRGKTRGKYI